MQHIVAEVLEEEAEERSRIAQRRLPELARRLVAAKDPRKELIAAARAPFEDLERVEAEFEVEMLDVCQRQRERHVLRRPDRTRRREQDPAARIRDHDRVREEGGSRNLRELATEIECKRLRGSADGEKQGEHVWSETCGGKRRMDGGPRDDVFYVKSSSLSGICEEKRGNYKGGRAKTGDRANAFEWKRSSIEVTQALSVDFPAAPSLAKSVCSLWNHSHGRSCSGIEGSLRIHTQADTFIPGHLPFQIASVYYRMHPLFHEL
jgi:hypothetical protein